MTETIVFLDTEFTNCDIPALISLGLVSEKGEELYIEISDTWYLAQCSLFVIGQVLPWMNGGAAEKTLRGKLGELFELIPWLTAESWDERRRLLEGKPLQDAIVHELELAVRWESETGFADLRAGDVPRVKQAMSELTPQTLLEGDDGSPARSAAAELGIWLSGEGRTTLVADSPIDFQLIRALLEQAGSISGNIDFRLLPDLKPSADANERRKVQQVRESNYARGGRRHHALDDARTLASWWKAARELDLLP